MQGKGVNFRGVKIPFFRLLTCWGKILNGYNSLPKQGVKSEFDIDYLVWLPIIKGYATLNDLRTIYDLEDAIAMHEVLIELLNEARRALEKQ